MKEENECGIFYYRFPNEKKGKVTSITLKNFLTVSGDGASTITELIKVDKRAKLYLNIIKNNYQVDLNSIPNKGEKIQLSVIGNHSKGTQFINGNYLITSKLEESVHNFSAKIKGWYYGRIDLKYNSIEELENGNFKVLEINGILAEPTHIYDATKTKYFGALKEIRTHWRKLHVISKINHELNGVKYASINQLIKDLINLKKYLRNLKNISN